MKSSDKGFDFTGSSRHDESIVTRPAPPRVRQECDSDDLADSEGPEPRQLRAVTIRRGRESDHFPQKGRLGSAQVMVQQVLPVVLLVHRREIVGEAEFHNIRLKSR